MDLSNITVACQRLLFILEHSHNMESDNLFNTCLKKTLVRSVATLLRKASVVRHHELLTHDEFLDVYTYCVQMIKDNERFVESVEILNTITANERPTPSNINITANEQLFKTYARNSQDARFLFECSTWESFDNEPTLLRQTHKVTASYIIDCLQMIDTIIHVASFTSNLFQSLSS